MTKNSTEICRLALEEIKVLGVSQDMPGDYLARAKTRLEALYGEMRDGNRGLVVDWTIEAVPDHLAMPLAVALAAYCARMFGRPITEAEKENAVGRLYAAMIEDDREDYRADDDIKRAAFF